MLLVIEIIGVDLIAERTGVPQVAVISLHMPIEANLVGVRLAAV